MGTLGKNKVMKADFLAKIAEENNIDMSQLEYIYEKIFEEIYATVCNGNMLVLNGFGTFYVQKHKGHPVQFDQKNSSVMPDYLVFKFSASDVINERIRKNIPI